MLCKSIVSTGALGWHAVRPTVAATVNANAARVYALRRHYSEQLLEIGRYHELADQALEYIAEQYEDQQVSLTGIDVDLAHGVLSLVLPPHGSYVINKQPANRQIWLASPVSGPKRYDWINDKWTYHRDNTTLGDLLRAETKSAAQEHGVEPVQFEELD